MADSCDAHVRRQKADLCSLNYDQLIMKLNLKPSSTVLLQICKPVIEQRILINTEAPKKGQVSTTNMPYLGRSGTSWTERTGRNAMTSIR